MKFKKLMLCFYVVLAAQYGYCNEEINVADSAHAASEPVAHQEGIYGGDGKRGTYNPSVDVSTKLKVKLLGEKYSPSQKVFYSIYDLTNKVYIAYNVVLNSADSEIIIPHINAVVPPENNRYTNSYKYKITFYGLANNSSYSVALPMEYTLDLNDLMYKVSDNKNCSTYGVKVSENVKFHHSSSFTINMDKPEVFSDPAAGNKRIDYEVCNNSTGTHVHADTATGNQSPHKKITYVMNINFRYNLDDYVTLNTQDITDTYSAVSSDI